MKWNKELRLQPGKEEEVGTNWTKIENEIWKKIRAIITQLCSWSGIFIGKRVDDAVGGGEAKFWDNIGGFVVKILCYLNYYAILNSFWNFLFNLECYSLFYNKAP